MPRYKHGLAFGQCNVPAFVSIHLVWNVDYDMSRATLIRAQVMDIVSSASDIEIRLESNYSEFRRGSEKMAAAESSGKRCNNRRVPALALSAGMQIMGRKHTAHANAVNMMVC